MAEQEISEDTKHRRRPAQEIPTHPEARLRLAQVEELTGRRKSWLYCAVREGRFPAPERDGLRCSRWRAADVLAFLNRQRSPEGVEVGVNG